MSAASSTDNVHLFGTPAEIALWRAVADRLGLTGGPLDAFRAATDDATANRADDLMRQGPVIFALKRHELDLPPGAKVKDHDERQRQVKVLERAYKAELRRAAKLRGMAGAEAGARTAEQEIIEDYAFDEVAGTWVRRSSMEHLKARAFEEQWTERLLPVLLVEKADGTMLKRPLSAWFKEQPNAMVVEGLCSTPAAPEGAVIEPLIKGRKKRLLNSWCDPVPDAIAGLGTITDRDVQPWLDLVAYVFDVPDHTAARAVPPLDWMAGVLANPGVKPNWALYMSGDAGTGKNLLLLPLEQALGAGMNRRISPADFSRAYDEYLEARLCIVAETRETTPGTITPHDLYARIKEIVDTTSGWMLVNVKSKAKVWVYSTTALALFSNQPNMLPVDARERRLGYYRVEMEKPKPPEYFKVLAAWLMANDDLFDNNTHPGTPGWKLVVKWLVQRWAGLDDARRAAFQGNAPATPEKAIMVSVAANPVKELLGAAVAGDFGDGKIPDLIDIPGVRERLQGMIDNGGFGVDKGTRIPPNATLGDWLRELKAERLNYEPIKRVHTQILCGNTRRRLWAVRNADKYRGLLPNVIAAMWRFLNRGI
jgi:hypothetical protein